MARTGPEIETHQVDGMFLVRHPCRDEDTMMNTSKTFAIVAAALITALVFGAMAYAPGG
jgi:hypothetical protein